MSATPANANPKTTPELPDAEYNRKWDQESQLQFIRKASDPRFGEIHVYKRKGTNELIFSKEKMTSSKAAAASDIRELKSRLALNRPHLQKLLGYSTSERKELCSTSYFTQGFYQFPKTDLAKENSVRVASGQSFTENELANITSQSLLGLKGLHAQKITHGDIRPQYIGINKDTNEVSLLDRLADPSPIEKTQSAHIVGGKDTLYMSPELYKKLQGKDRVIKYDPFKNDVYSLALSVLETGTGKSVKDIYNTNGTVDQAKLDAHLNAFSAKYQGDYLNNFVRSSLKQDESARPLTEELSSRLGTWNDNRVWAQGPSTTTTTTTETITHGEQKTGFASNVVSEPSLFDNINTTTTTTEVITQPGFATKEVVTAQSVTPAFLKNQNNQSNYTVTGGDNYSFKTGSQQYVNKSYSIPTETSTFQEYQAYSQKQGSLPTGSQTKVETSNSQWPLYSSTYSNAPVTTSYTQAPVTTTYVNAPVTTTYSNTPVTTTYTQAPVTTSYSQAPVTTTYAQAPTTYTQAPVTTTYAQPTTTYTQAPVTTTYTQAPVTTTYAQPTTYTQAPVTTTYTQAPVTTTYTQPTTTYTQAPQYVSYANSSKYITSEPQYVSSYTNIPTEYITREPITTHTTPSDHVTYTTTQQSYTNLPTTQTQPVTYVTTTSEPTRIEYSKPVTTYQTTESRGKSVVFANALTPAYPSSISTQHILTTPTTQTVSYLQDTAKWIPSSERIVTNQTTTLLSEPQRTSYKTIPTGRRSVSFINHTDSANPTEVTTRVARPSWTTATVAKTTVQPTTITWEEYQEIKRNQQSTVTPVTVSNDNHYYTSTVQESTPVYEVQHHHNEGQPTQAEEIRQVVQQYQFDAPQKTTTESYSEWKTKDGQSAELRVKKYKIQNGKRIEVSDFTVGN